MDEPILFNPDNRLLHSATGDLGMYGGQSEARFSVHEASDNAAGAVSPAGTANVAVALEGTDAAAEAAPLPETNTDVAVHADSGSGALAAHSFLIAPTAPELAQIQPIGLGETIGTVHSGAVAAEQGAGAPTPDIHPASEAAAGTLSEAPVIGTAASLIDHLADGPATGSVGGLADGALSPITDTVGDVLTTTVGLVDDTLEGLAGSDPLAGVETLVSMVSNSDTFDLAPVVAPLLETVSDTGLGVVDALVGEDSPADTLLGSHHDGGLLGLDHHDNPLGL